MNILKTLRKPHFAMFLASLMLFVSCSQDKLSEDLEIQTQTLDEYFAKHIELTSEMAELKDSVDYDVVDKLTKLQNKSGETSDLEFSLKNENIEISDEIFELQLRIIENTRILYNNPKYNSLNQEEFLSVIKGEISDQFENKQNFSQRTASCLGAFNTANRGCLRSFAASAATVGVIGLFTSFGVGSLIGGAIALVRFGECNESAQAVLSACRLD
jgi:hypothetical protein